MPPGGDEMTRYLLGEMAEAERDAFEDRYFGDDEVYERLAAVEGELLDDYVRGRLPAARRAALETTLLATPGGRERLAFARALAERAPVAVSVAGRVGLMALLASWFGGHRSIAVAGLAATALAVVAGVSWLALQRESEAPPPERAHTPAPEPAPVPSPAPSPAPPAPAPQPAPPPDTPAPAPPPSRSVVAFAFGAQTVRNVQELRVLRVPRDAETVRLRLDFEPDEHARYTAVLRTAEGREVLRRSGLASRRAGEVERVTLDLPASRLADEEYVLALEGPGEAGVVADYIFRVDRE